MKVNKWMELQLMTNVWNCKNGMNAWKWMHRIAIKEWMHGNECMDCKYGIQCMDLNVFHWKLVSCKFKFDCEWGNGMGPQGLGMVPWESPSGLLSPTVPWVQW